MRTTHLPVPIGELTLLISGLLLSQLPSTAFAEDRPAVTSVGVLAVLIVTYALVLQLTLGLWRRRYAAEHEDVLALN